MIGSGTGRVYDVMHAGFMATMVTLGWSLWMSRHQARPDVWWTRRGVTEPDGSRGRTSTGSRALRAGRGACLAACGFLVLGFFVAVVSWYVVRPENIALNAWSTPKGRQSSPTGESR